jgi:hypothetical protein
VEYIPKMAVRTIILTNQWKTFPLNFKRFSFPFFYLLPNLYQKKKNCQEINSSNSHLGASRAGKHKEAVSKLAGEHSLIPVVNVAGYVLIDNS